jgi:hypothetical protein
MTPTVSTRSYEASHGRTPANTWGGWIFENLRTGEWFEITSTYKDAVEALPEGNWKVMP